MELTWGWDSRKDMTGGGGPKVELNPKKIPILGQFGTLKYTNIQNTVP